MKQLPADPFAFQAAVFDALAQDLLDMGAGKSRSFARTDALREISKQSTRDGGGDSNPLPSNQ